MRERGLDLVSSHAHEGLEPPVERWPALRDLRQPCTQLELLPRNSWNLESTPGDADDQPTTGARLSERLRESNARAVHLPARRHESGTSELGTGLASATTCLSGVNSWIACGGGGGGGTNALSIQGQPVVATGADFGTSSHFFLRFLDAFLWDKRPQYQYLQQHVLCTVSRADSHNLRCELAAVAPWFDLARF